MTTPIPEGTGVRQDAQWADWRHVRAGQQVALKNRGWLVAVKGASGMVLEPNDGGSPLSGPPPNPGGRVLVLYPGHPMHSVPAAAELLGSAAGSPRGIDAELAVAAVTLHLGGHVLATHPLTADGELPDPAGQYECPDPAGIPNQHLRAHLVLFHDLSGVVPDRVTGGGPVALQALHATTLHSVPHTHAEPQP